MDPMLAFERALMEVMKERQLREEFYLSRLQKVASRVQVVRSWLKESSRVMKSSNRKLEMYSRSTKLELVKPRMSPVLGIYLRFGMALWMDDETCSMLEKDVSMLEKGFVEYFFAQLDVGVRVRSCDRTSTQMRQGHGVRRYEYPQLGIIRASPFVEAFLEPGSMERPEYTLSKGPIKPSEPPSEVETHTWTPDEIRDHDEKLMNRLAPQFTEHIKSALLPVLGPVAAALQEERKHQEKLLELEERQLALRIRFKRRGVGRCQRRRRASSARRLRPRTRQLGPSLRFPWKR